MHDAVNLLVGYGVKGVLLGEILPDQAICIFIQSPFPGCIGMRKKEADVQSLGNGLMSSEFFAVIRRQGVKGEAEGFQQGRDRGCDGVGTPRATLARRLNRDLRSVKETSAC